MTRLNGNAITITHGDTLDVTVGMSLPDGAFEQFAFVQERIGFDLSAEFVFESAAVKRIAAAVIAAEIEIDRCGDVCFRMRQQCGDVG